MGMQSQMKRNNHPGHCKGLYKNNLSHKMIVMCVQRAMTGIRKQVVDHRQWHYVTHKQ